MPYEKRVLAADPYAGYMASLLTGWHGGGPNQAIFRNSRLSRPSVFGQSTKFPRSRVFCVYQICSRFFDTVPLDQTDR